ncbi:type II toxin-antitoxin system antitoxin SocA domain-containing protein [Candidatus Cyanaurora vandensis]|uniref:type II toxin-antitoxin system antitoxin SocA domain-containing protein n=1 Tax=Candidatus Cyanaurora vandensis TaxID=2714958 RepID=UPI00257FE3E7|nr:type II toxin-antitoxin system antitoxin SocA domain-containing protein [Candidatus Cyanaurora vandensis]
MPDTQILSPLIEAAAVLLNFADNKSLKTVCLNKALFYLDLSYLRDYGEMLTKTAYIALTHGPVVAKYDKKLIKPLIEAGLATQEQAGDTRPVKLVKLPTKFHFDNDKVISLAIPIAEHFSQVSSLKASDLSHENLGWRLAYQEGLEAKKSPLPINMTIAMQQVLDDDPWLSEETSELSWKSIYEADHYQYDNSRELEWQGIHQATVNG